MKETPLVSVIIPIYNTEKYLKQCIDSVINQTYKNLEIILVDDGSTDSSPAICDEYAAKDSRITVIHKENEGVSSARNAGLNRASGGFFSFVDSDDCLSEKFIEDLLARLQEDSSDIAMSDFINSDGSIVFPYYKTDSVKTAEKLLSDFLNRKIEIGSCCGKIYKKSVVESVSFDETLKLHEDQLFVVDCLSVSKKISVLSSELYYYRNNADSAIHTDNPDFYLNGCVAATLIMKHISDNLPQLIKESKCLVISHAFYCYLNLCHCSNAESQKAYCLRIIKEYRKDVLFNKGAALKTRGACLLSYFGMNNVSRVYRIIKREK